MLIFLFHNCTFAHACNNVTVSYSLNTILNLLRLRRYFAGDISASIFQPCFKNSSSTGSTLVIKIIQKGASTFLKLKNDPAENLRLLSGKTKKRAAEWRLLINGDETEYVLKHNDIDTMEQICRWMKTSGDRYEYSLELIDDNPLEEGMCFCH